MDIYGKLVINKDNESTTFSDLNFIEDAERIKTIVSLAWENGYQCTFVFSESVSEELN